MVLGQPQQLQNQAGPTIPARRGSPRFRARGRRRVPPRTQRSAPSTGAECVAVDAIALSRIVGDAPLASFHLHDVKQRGFFVPMTRSCARVLYFRFVGWVERKRNPSPSHRAPSRWVSLRSTHPTSSSQHPRPRGGRSAGRRQPLKCRARKRATSRLRGVGLPRIREAAPRRSTVALSPRNRFHRRHCCRLRREGSTQPGISAGRGTGLLVSAGYEPRSTPHPRSAIRIVSGDAPHERGRVSCSIAAFRSQPLFVAKRSETQCLLLLGDTPQMRCCNGSRTPLHIWRTRRFFGHHRHKATLGRGREGCGYSPSAPKRPLLVTISSTCTAFGTSIRNSGSRSR